MKLTVQELFDRAARKAGFSVRPVNVAHERPAPRHAAKRAGRNGRASAAKAKR